MYRIYQLEEVIHENLRPEKSQETQKAGGKRKSYNSDPDDGEAPGNNKAATKKPRRKVTKKDVVEAVERGVVGVGGDASAQVDEGGLPSNGREANLLTTGLDGDEADVARVVQKRKKRRIKKNL